MRQDLLDRFYMSLALDEARLAFLAGETPVGAVVVWQGRVIARSGNRKEAKSLALAHAEMEVMVRASRVVGDWRLVETTLYVTLEPCFMCAGAMLQARVGRLVYGAVDPKAGAVESLCNLVADQRLNHQIITCGGVLASQSRDLLQKFFRLLRTVKKQR